MPTDKTLVTAALVLWEALKQERIRPGSIVPAVAFGSRLSMGGTVIRWCGDDDFRSTQHTAFAAAPARFQDRAGR
ncbi:hypothetical protein [Streptomyces sp. 2A115]|uniref:hypothetical protein n=1 Tax=Streptomyces sp. 2A115 TaxID=3457439 RepID=UPI003FD0B478